MSTSSRESQTTAAENATLTDTAIIAATRCWIERAVIGLNLCPFARTPFTQQRIRFSISHALSTDALVVDLSTELQMLQAIDAQLCETTLLIHPFVLANFLDYNDFLEVADDALHGLGLHGELQIASFHPGYRFADTAADAVENFSNRSPYPILHLLREASVERAVASMADTDSIYRRNIETLRALGSDGWRVLWREDSVAADTEQRQGNSNRA